MLHIGSHVRYFYYQGAVDMRKGSYSLSVIVCNQMQLNVLSGDVFVFVSRRGNKIKLLQWDKDGFAVYEKRLEKGRFKHPDLIDEQSLALTSIQLQHILQGVISGKKKQKNILSKKVQML